MLQITLSKNTNRNKNWARHLLAPGDAVQEHQPEQELGAGVAIGDPDTIGEALAANLTLGVDGFTINLIPNGHVPGRVSLLGEVAAKVVGASS